jgi:hypothetical protein
MAALIAANSETVAPSEADTLLARESSRRLATRKLGRRRSIRIQVIDAGGEAETVDVPASALRLYLQVPVGCILEIRCAVDEPGGTTLTEVSSCMQEIVVCPTYRPR